MTRFSYHARPERTWAGRHRRRRCWLMHELKSKFWQNCSTSRSRSEKRVVLHGALPHCAQAVLRLNFTGSNTRLRSNENSHMGSIRLFFIWLAVFFLHDGYWRSGAEVQRAPHTASSATAASRSLCDDKRSCENTYIEALSRIRESWGTRVQSFMCSYDVTRAPTAEELIFFFPSPGTTGTRSMTVFLGKTCGWDVHHSRAYILGREQEHPPWQPADIRTNGDNAMRAEGSSLMDDARLMRPEREALHAMNETTDSFLDSHRILPDLIPPGRDMPVDAVLDSPMAALFFDIFHQFPNARFVLLHRDPALWAPSRKKHHPDSTAPILRMPASAIPDASLDEMAAVFTAHEAYVRCKVPPERLLEVDYFKEISQRVGWTEQVTAGAVAEAQMAAFVEAAGRPCLRYTPSAAVAEAVAEQAAGVSGVLPTGMGGGDVIIASEIVPGAHRRLR
ncbi:unnamed protein product [Phaeothamnion confervicola]